MTADRYDIYVQVERGQRMSERGRKQEPRELFGEVIDALVANGWQLCGDVRVRRMVLDIGTGEYL